MRRSWRLVLLATLALAMLPACGHTDRPEGVVERWLISLNQGKAGRPDQYAPESLSQRILPHWASRDPGDLDVIEVGKVRLDSDPPQFSAEVPFRVKRLGGWSLIGIAGLYSHGVGHWHITAIKPQSAFPTLKVPSQGGERIGNASATLWLSALGLAFLLLLGTAALMSTVGRPKTTAATAKT